jgi:hypothetical protein
LYDIDQNSIRLNLEIIKTEARLIGGEKYSEFSSAIDCLVLLSALIHEEVHAVSFNRRGDRVIVGGYKICVADAESNSWLELYTALDEGLTEMIARSLLVEYLKEDSELAKTEAAVGFLRKLKFERSSYDLEVVLVDNLIKKIATTSGMSEETVRQAIVRSKLDGVDLAETELAQFLDEQTYVGFSEDIKRLQPAGTETGIDEVHSCLHSLDPAWAKKRRAEKVRETSSIPSSQSTPPTH